MVITVFNFCSVGPSNIVGRLNVNHKIEIQKQTNLKTFKLYNTQKFKEEKYMTFYLILVWSFMYQYIVRSDNNTEYMHPQGNGFISS